MKRIFIKTFAVRATLCGMVVAMTMALPASSFAVLPKGSRSDKAGLAIAVTGTVKDNKGLPLPGVSILVKGTTTGTVSDANGKYSITVTDGSSTLIFSYAGFKKQEIVVGSRTRIDITMEEDVSNLSEVVITGYGSQSRETLTTAVSKLDTKTLENVPYSNALSAMQGSLPGVRVQSNSGQPGAAPRVTLRGGTTINNARANSANNPLYLVDGVIRENLNDIPTDDIESLQVLKDAASTSIYGARASNGVVLVTTKSARAGATRIGYSYDFSTSEKPPLMEYTSASEYLTYARLGNIFALGKVSPTTVNGRLTGPIGYGTGNDLTNGTGFTPQFLTPENQYKLDEGWEVMTDPIKTNDRGEYDPNGTNKQIIYKSTDFNELTFKRGASHNHYITASGGTEKAKFNAGLGYLTDEGIAHESFYNRLSANINGSLQLTKKLNVNGRVLFSNADVNGPGVNQNGINQETNGQFGVLAETFYRSTGLPATAKYQFEDGTMAPGQSNSLGNPHYYQTGPGAPITKNTLRKTTVSLGAKWDILPGLTFDPLLAYFEDDANGRYFQPGRLIGAGGSQTSRIARKYDYTTSSYQADAVFSYAKSLSNHNFGAKLGYSYYNRMRNRVYVEGQGAATDLIPTLNASTTFNPSSFADELELATEGVFGRLNYDYNQKYLLELTGRYDGASNLGSDNRFAFFPGVGLGWNVHKENFWKVMPEQISSFKLRATYGENGNIQGLPEYDWQGTFSNSSYNNQAAIVTGALPNPSLRWEQSRTLDAGLDLGLFGNRISMILDYYERVTDDLLASVALPTSSGYGSVRTNNGSLKNKGFEADLNISVLPAASALQWNVNFNAAKVSTRIIELPSNGQPNNRQSTFEVWDPEAGAYVHVAGFQAGNPFGNPVSLMEGSRIGDMYAYKQIGVYATDAEAANAPFDTGASTDLANSSLRTKYGGDVIWADLDGNGIIDTKDQVYMGNTFPTWTGGFSNYLTYKGFNLAIRTDFTLGHTIYNYPKATADGQLQGDIMPTKDFIDKSWKKQGDITNTPRYTHQINGNVSRSSAYYEKGDFLALREVTLGYNLPGSVVRKIKLSGVRVNLTGSNLHYFTNYTGLSPEEGGSDGGRYPLSRSIVLGLNVTF